MTSPSLRERLAAYGVNDFAAAVMERELLDWLSDNKLRIVPEESTSDMYAAGAKKRGLDPDDTYAAMLSAAPSNAAQLEKAP